MCIRDRLKASPYLRHVVVIGDDNPASQHVDFAVALGAEKPEFTTAATHADETAFWLYSSGSTGRPKGARHVHTSMMQTAKLFAQGVVGF